jgi:hypothetical protein
MGHLLHALHQRQPLDNLRTVPGATEHYSMQPGEADAFAQEYAARLDSINGDDLSNELDEQVCDILLTLLNRQDYERAGRVLDAVRSAYAHRLVSVSYGERPRPEHDGGHAARVACLMGTQS